jgi:sugar/nucleoside kinase (ribokinase family)
MLLVLGDALLDITIAPEGALVPGADLLGKIVMGPGGSAANFAYWAARLGEQVTLIAPVGQDLPGQLVRAHLDAARVRLISDHTGATGMVAAVIGAAGERTLITQLDPSARPPARASTWRSLRRPTGCTSVAMPCCKKSTWRARCMRPRGRAPPARASAWTSARRSAGRFQLCGRSWSR